MTICTQQSEISLVGFPVLESPRPSVLAALWAHFFGRVNVVNVERPMIRKSTLDALPAKLLNYFKFSFPVARVLVNGVPVLVPVALNTFKGTKPIFAISAALFALPTFSPSRRKVAGLIAIFSCPIFDAIGVRLEYGFAPRAFNVNFCALSHNADYITLVCRFEPKYFDIACERIENAQRQQKLFGDAA